MGDLRNKFAKLERQEAHQRFLAKHYPPTPRNHVVLICKGCLRNDAEKTIYSCSRGHFDPVEYWCLDCLPDDLKAEFGL